MSNLTVPLIIPSYEPNDALVDLCANLKNRDITNIVVVDDGSGEKYEKIFDALRNLKITVLIHSVNLGKGRALKDAFNYVLINTPHLTGCVTADSDGQHTPDDIIRCIDKLMEFPNNLILGCRLFNSGNVPWKSAFGNKLTKKISKYLCGINVSDTQTGLRGIPYKLMEELMNVPGERFEFETNMLLYSKSKINIIEIDIQTVYDSKNQHKTHFDPIKDSIQIYKIFGIIFLKFSINSISSAAIDLWLFNFFCKTLYTETRYSHILLSTVFARIISSSYNYLINYKIVFKSRAKIRLSTFKYFILVTVQMLLSALFVNIGVTLFTELPKVGIKAVIDIFLFFISYIVQRRLIF